MKRTSAYLSDTFINIVWPSFSKGCKKEVTRSLYFSDICEFADYIKKDFLIATTTDCKCYLDYLEGRNLQYSTRLKKYRELSSVYTFICRYPDLIGKTSFTNPMALISVEPVEDEISKDSILDIQVVDRLIQYLYEYDRLCHFSVLLSLKFMLKTNEIITLKKKNFFFDQHERLQLQVVDAYKNTRYLQVPEDIIPIVLDYLEPLQTDAYLFFNKKTKKPYTTRTLQLRLSNAFQKIGSPSYSLNDIRNTGILICSSSGASAEDIADTLGYKSTTHINRLECRHIEIPDKGVDLNMVALKFKR